MFPKYLTQLWSPRTRLLSLLSVGLVIVGMISWIRFIDILQGQTNSTFVQTGALLNSVGFLFLASQLSTVGVVFYAYSLSARKASEWEGRIETAVEAIQTFIREQKEPGTGQLPKLDFKTFKELAAKKASRTRLIPILEGIAILLLYAWLVAEFRTDINSEHWASQNAQWTLYVVNEYILFLFAGVLASVTFSWVRARRSFRRTTKSSDFEIRG